MPFVGQDWRSPGDKWIRTEFGWKRLADIRNGLNVHPVNQRHILRPRNQLQPRATSRESNVNGHSDANGVWNKSKRSEPSSPTPQVSSADNRTKQLFFLLSQRCVSAGKTSRESSQYSTISDAISKLNFIQALGDENCFQFICKAITLLYKERYHLLSGSMQATLLRLTGTAKEIAIETKKHTDLVMEVIEAAVSTLEKGRRQQFPGHTTCSTDVKTKLLLKMKCQLLDVLHQAPFRHQEDLTISNLHQDCLRHIISYLLHPRDVLHLGQANYKLYTLTEENWIWRNLAKFHYGKEKSELGMERLSLESEDRPWKAVFEEEYRSSKGSLKEEVSDAVYLCTGCDFVFWKSYGHPCCASKDMDGVDNQQFTSRRLTAEEFLRLFCY